MPGYFPLVGHACVYDYITVRCPSCKATYILALPRIPKFSGTVHSKVDFLRSAWGACGDHPSEITVEDRAAAHAAS